MYSYEIDGTPLGRVYVVKDLEVILDSKLSFQNHYSSSISKANRNLGFIVHILCTWTFVTRTACEPSTSR